MNKFKLKSIPALKLLVVVFLATFTMQGQSNTSPTESECVNAWTSSAASNTCGADNSTYYINAVSPSVDTTSYVVSASNGECRVEVHCLKSDTTVAPVANDYSGTTSQVSDLNNCEGDLKEGNC